MTNHNHADPPPVLLSGLSPTAGGSALTTVSLRGTACVDYDEDSGRKSWTGCSLVEMRRAVDEALDLGGECVDEAEAEYSLDGDTKEYNATVRVPEDKADAYVASFARSGSVEAEAWR